MFNHDIVLMRSSHQSTSRHMFSSPRILLYHDFMFSDQIYPWDDAFLASVALETAYQVRRLSKHASLVLWSGTNELLPGVYVQHFRLFYVNFNLFGSDLFKSFAQFFACCVFFAGAVTNLAPFEDYASMRPDQVCNIMLSIAFEIAPL